MRSGWWMNQRNDAFTPALSRKDGHRRTEKADCFMIEEKSLMNISDPLMFRRGCSRTTKNDKNVPGRNP